MQAPVQPFNLGIGPISRHAWNKDKTQVAVSPNNNEVHIFAWQRGQWERLHVLQEHDLPVTGIDWAPNTNRIVTCSQDKNAFVWTFDGKVWKPELVLVRFQRAATCVKWSPFENKFAVGSGSKLVAICYYEKENDWWVSKHVKKLIKSTVTSLDWHPNNVLLAVGSCDFKTRIFSAYIKEVDGDKATPTPWAAKPGPLGQVVTEFSCGGGGWVHCVKFSPSGNRMAWVGHDSSLTVLDAADQSNITTIKDWYLPFTCVVWVTENSLVAGGHDCCPLLFSYGGRNKLKFVSKLDVPSEQKSNSFTAMTRFKNLDKSNAAEVETALKTLHQNAITWIAPHTTNGDRVTKFTTSGTDGLLVLWDLQKLESTVSSITLV